MVIPWPILLSNAERHSIPKDGRQHRLGNMQDFLAALALVFVLEGGLYALFPAGMKRMMAQTITP